MHVNIKTNNSNKISNNRSDDGDEDGDDGDGDYFKIMTIPSLLLFSSKSAWRFVIFSKKYNDGS